MKKTNFSIEEEHTQMVKKLVKSGQTILDEMTPEHWRLLQHAVFNGLLAAERMNGVKKQVIYQKDLGIELVVKGKLPEGLTAEKCHLLHMAIGVFGEAAELMESTYAHVNNNTPLDRKNTVEESGDIEFYLKGHRIATGITRAEILAENVSKLNARYPGFNYSDIAAQARADKA